ncbi:hypothetical protein EDB81DRAFT_893338 [Dactylonectria macrodidyma]|uniref:Uncharacterized protein n=1 Tax=Dactylonectria macrodidyma TaxID=307937 RepID=A0A9P9IBR0_9HYPO|nr:hypothetical protein EDB81DRAFT_893338 [Dactylonectria macrodidyma]
MNVLAKCKGFFKKATKVGTQIARDKQFQEFLDEWNILVNSATIKEYEDRLQAFERPGKYPELAVRYAKSTWLKWKEKVVSCFVDEHRHFGHFTTSIVESLHAAMILSTARLWPVARAAACTASSASRKEEYVVLNSDSIAGGGSGGDDDDGFN